MNSVLVEILCFLLTCNIFCSSQDKNVIEKSNALNSRINRFLQKEVRYDMHFMSAHRDKIISVVESIVSKYVAGYFINDISIDKHKCFIFESEQYITNELDSVIFLGDYFDGLVKNNFISNYVYINIGNLLYHHDEEYNKFRRLHAEGKGILYVISYDELQCETARYQEYVFALQEFLQFICLHEDAMLCISSDGKIMDKKFINSLNEYIQLINENKIFANNIIKYNGFNFEDKLTFLIEMGKEVFLKMGDALYQKLSVGLFYHAAKRIHTLFGLLFFLNSLEELVKKDFAILENLVFCEKLIDFVVKKVEFEYIEVPGGIENNLLGIESKNIDNSGGINTNVTFDEIIGYEKEKGIVKSYIKKMKRRISAKHRQSCMECRSELIKMPHLIFYGPPGTGKTVFLQAIANELKINYKIISSNEIVSFMPGVSEQNLENLMNEIKEKVPILLIFEEGEVLFPRRDNQFNKSSGLVNIFLQYLDGIKAFDGYSFIICTNYIEDIDPAILRPGRITQKVYLGFPDLEDRKKIIDFYLKKYEIHLGEDVCRNDIALNLDGFAGADIKYFVEFIYDYFEDGCDNNSCEKVVDKALFSVLFKEFILQLNIFQNKITFYPDSGFKDIAGYQNIKDELMQYVEELKGQYEKKTKMPGIIFTGQPGVGKTQFAKAIAGEAGVPMIIIDSSDIGDPYIGVAEKKLKEIFSLCAKSSPVILFIDEIDGVFFKRGTGNDNSARYENKLTNLFLTFLDGITASNKGVLVICTTNHYDMLDPALVRSGRLDRKIVIENPNWFDTVAIVEYYIKQNNIVFEKSIPIEKVAARLDGFSPSDIKKYIELLGKRLKKDRVEVVDLSLYADIYQEMILGKRKQHNSSDEVKYSTAYHEACHGLVQFITYRQGDNLYEFDFLTTVSRASALGISWGKKPGVMEEASKNKLYGYLATALAGKAAEEVFFNHQTTGPESDLEQVVAMAKDMVLRFGMGKKFVYAESDNDCYNEVNALVAKLYKEVISFLKKHKLLVKKIVKKALEKETLFIDEMAAIVSAYEKKTGKKVIFNFSMK